MERESNKDQNRLVITVESRLSSGSLVCISTENKAESQIRLAESEAIVGIAATRGLKRSQGKVCLIAGRL